MSNFEQYVNEDLTGLLTAAARIGLELAQMFGIRSDLETDQQREKARVWEDCGAESVSARDRYAQIHTLSYQTELLTLKGKIEAKQQEYDLIVLVLTFRAKYANYLDPASIPRT